MSVNYCPICGVATKDEIIAAAYRDGYKQHRCCEKTLRAIDSTSSQDRVESDKRSFGGRLAEGFAMIGDFYED